MKCSSRTFNGAIELFQNTFNLKRDGKITPGGETERALARVTRSELRERNSKSERVVKQASKIQPGKLAQNSSGIITRGTKALLNDEQIANIIFNESRSLSGPKIDEARRLIAHAVINGDEMKGKERPWTADSSIRQLTDLREF